MLLHTLVPCITPTVITMFGTLLITPCYLICSTLYHFVNNKDIRSNHTLLPDTPRVIREADTAIHTLLPDIHLK